MIGNRATCAPASGLEKGGYTLWQSGSGTPDVTLVASGSEVGICLAAAKRLEGRNVRVVSMPCRELFARQDAAYRDSVLDPKCAKRLVVEAGSRLGWEAYAGPAGKILSIDGFGASGPAKTLAAHFGFTADNVLALAREL